MPRKKLTTAAIPHLAPGEWYDTIVPGLILRAGKRRRKWDCRFYADGGYQREPLGYFPNLGLDAARDAARRMIERSDRGLPLPETAAPHPRSSDALTLGRLIDDYERLRRREAKKIKTLNEALRLIRRALAPYLSVQASEFSKADLRAARDALVDSGAPFAGNRMLGYFGPVMRWAAQEDLVPVNFVGDIRKAPENKRTRKLNDAEIRAIWRGCDSLGNSFGRMVQFLLFSLQRRSEVASLRHGDIIDGRWKQEQNKSSRPHSLRLPPLALALVGQGAAKDYVFAGQVGRISGFSKLKIALDRASGVSDWRLHDLRRSGASRMQGLGVPNHVIQAVLNHAVPGVGGHYLQDEMEKQKADALAAWAAEITKIVGPLRVSA